MSGLVLGFEWIGDLLCWGEMLGEMGGGVFLGLVMFFFMCFCIFCRIIFLCVFWGIGGFVWSLFFVRVVVFVGLVL